MHSALSIRCHAPILKVKSAHFFSPRFPFMSSVQRVDESETAAAELETLLTVFGPVLGL